MRRGMVKTMGKVGMPRSGCVHGTTVPKIIIIYRAANGNRYPFAIDAKGRLLRFFGSGVQLVLIQSTFNRAV